MDRETLIHIREADFGSHPEAFALNASFREDLPILKLRVEIDWEPKAPRAALSSLESGLLAVCPSLRDHHCGGDPTYHVLRSTEHGQIDESEAAIEAPLALAHLFEHVIIDAISFITDEPVISGATAALQGSFNRFDVFVESPDMVAACLTVALARSWIIAIVAGASPDGVGWVTFELCRHLYRSRPQPVEVGATVRGLAHDADEVRSGLEWLVQHGLAQPVPYTMNFNGLSYYELSVGSSLDLTEAVQRN